LRQADVVRVVEIEAPIHSEGSAGQAHDGAAPAMTAIETSGRLRLCPYYFVVAGQPRLSGALATFCPPDKKIIHGMTDAALLPCRTVNPPVGS
jgi:hypothetical protein